MNAAPDTLMEKKIDTDLIYEGIATPPMSRHMQANHQVIDTDLIYEGIATLIR